jgi:hypothetical protein
VLLKRNTRTGKENIWRGNTITNIIMEQFNNKYLIRLSAASLITTCWSLSVAVCAPRAPLKIGDEYGGGKIALILEPGDPGYSDLAEQFMVTSKTDISKTDDSKEAKEASDSMEETSHYDRYLQSNARRNQDMANGYNR